ncbi:MAG: hypothetical protein OXD36_05450 [Rhodobacter sp.]|nr:hypothetical protein [Rhodobacter sp.]
MKSALIYARLPPDAVIRDPDFVFSLPKEPSVTSGPNAMAHAVAALYARDRIAEIGKLAVWGLTAFPPARKRRGAHGHVVRLWWRGDGSTKYRYPEGRSV